MPFPFMAKLVSDDLYSQGRSHWLMRIQIQSVYVRAYMM